MTTTLIAPCELETPLAHWLHEQLGDIDSLELVTDHPWAQTYRVECGDDVCFAKQLPPEQRAALGAMPLLTERFANTLPAVVAIDEDHGWIVFRDHGGRELSSSRDASQQLPLLENYAAIQSAAAQMPDLLNRLPRLDLGSLCERFHEFLKSTCQLNDIVGAAQFLSDDSAADYEARFAIRRPFLEQLIAAANELPLTINHGDLRMKNVAARADGSLVIFDWDEATVAPAGMSLHNFFSGCSTPAAMLLGIQIPAGDSFDTHRAMIEGYVSALLAGNYAPCDAIERGLPGAMCAGVMHYLLSYGKFPTDDASGREQVAKIIRRRLDDLLWLADLMASSNSATTLQHVDDYESSKHLDRAQKLLRMRLLAVPTDVAAQARLVSNMIANGETSDAQRVCRGVLEREPQRSDMRAFLGRMLVDALDLEHAVDQLRLAASFAPDDRSLQRELDDAVLLQSLSKHAAQSGQVPTIRFTPRELQTGTMSRVKRRLAARLFREYGTLVVENVFDPTMLDGLADEFADRYRSYLSGGRPDDALKVGDKRFMITVDVHGSWNNPNLYAAPLLTPILARMLGDEFILGSFTAVASLPGADKMRVHKDHPALFDDEEVSNSLPTVGITTLIPLRGFDLTMGTTRVWKGSHRCNSTEAAEMEYQDPCAPKGSCLLMDYRLTHQGLANRSINVRPVLSVVYNRPWFRDAVNYALQEPLTISREEFDRVPDDHKRLFAWTKP